MASKKPDIVPALVVVGGVFSLGFAVWALSDKSRYATAEHKAIVDIGVANALRKRDALGRPLTAEEISAIYAGIKSAWNEPLSGMDQKRIWNAARG